MTHFRLSYSADKNNSHGKTVDFDAADAGAALNIAFRHARNGTAELWCEDRMLCRIQCADDDGGYWLIS